MSQTASEWPVFDGHSDSLQDYFLDGRDPDDFFAGSDTEHLDYPRARAGGLVGSLFALFTPPPGGRRKTRKGQKKQRPTEADFIKWQSPVETQRAETMARQGFAAFRALEAASEGRFKVVRAANELPAAEPGDCLHAVIHFEGAEPVAPDLSNLESFYAEGLRSIGLVWSRPNAFGAGVTLKFEGNNDQGPGLSPAGKDLVRACNQMGILLDVSHLNQPGFKDVAEASSKPFVASHSSVQALCPSPRNLDDWQLDAIAQSGGLVGINFAVGFLRPDGELDPDTPLDIMVRHFSYIAGRIGVEHLALGSDFDGATIPQAIGDAAGMPVLLQALKDAGFSDEEIKQIACTNWLRVLREVWVS
jgi:membrane dipeptidase